MYIQANNEGAPNRGPLAVPTKSPTTGAACLPPCLPFRPASARRHLYIVIVCHHALHS